VGVVARILRSSLPDGFFHITANAVFETVLFKTDADRLLFLALLTTAARRHSIEIYAICLLDTHYHAIVSGRVEDLSSALHCAHSTYAREHIAPTVAARGGPRSAPDQTHRRALRPALRLLGDPR
jgi:hypothetical protein